MNKLIKSLSFVALFGSVASLSFGQSAPAAEVDINGNLVLNPGTPEEETILKPEGSVDGNGALVIDGNDPIPAPDATVDSSTGELVLGDGTRLPVPDSPVGDIIDWFGDDLVDIGAPKGWYFSWTLKNLFHFEGNNWFYHLETDAIIFINQESGGGSIVDGVWCYTQNLFPGQSSGTWFFVKRSNGFFDLRDENEDGTAEGDGFVDGTDPQEVIPFDGFIYIVNADGYTGTGGSNSGFFFVGEFSGGTFIWRVGDLENAVEIQGAL